MQQCCNILKSNIYATLLHEIIPYSLVLEGRHTIHLYLLSILGTACFKTLI